MEGENKNSKEGLSENFELDRDLRISKQLVLESIRNNGVEGSEALLSAWWDQAHKWSEEDPSDIRRALIVFASYDFYIANGDEEGAEECLEEAIHITQQGQGLKDLEAYIKKTINW